MLTKLHNLTLIMFIVIGAFLCFAGIFGLSDDEKQLQYAASSINWPSTEAVIETNKITVEPDRLAKNASTYKSDFKYHYQVGGKEFKSSKIAFGVDFLKPTDDAVLNWQTIYKTGTRHKVYYDRKDPSVAVLLPGVEVSYELKGAGALFLGLYLIIASVVSLTAAKRLEARNGLYLRLLTGLSLAFCSPVLFYGQQWQHEFLRKKVDPQSYLLVEKNGYRLGEGVKSSESSVAIPY